MPPPARHQAKRCHEGSTRGGGPRRSLAGIRCIRSVGSFPSCRGSHGAPRVRDRPRHHTPPRALEVRLHAPLPPHAGGSPHDGPVLKNGQGRLHIVTLQQGANVLSPLHDSRRCLNAPQATRRSQGKTGPRTVASAAQRCTATPSAGARSFASAALARRPQSNNPRHTIRHPHSTSVSIRWCAEMSTTTTHNPTRCAD